MTNSERTKLTNKVKNFVLHELEEAKKNPFSNVLVIRSIAFGAVFFATNDLFDTYNDDLADWWDKEILPQFNKMIRGD